MADVTVIAPASPDAQAASPATGGAGSRRASGSSDYLALVPFHAYIGLFLILPTLIVAIGALTTADGQPTVSNLRRSSRPAPSPSALVTVDPAGPHHGDRRRDLRRPSRLGGRHRRSRRRAAAACRRRVGRARPVRWRHARLRVPRDVRLPTGWSPLVLQDVVGTSIFWRLVLAVRPDRAGRRLHVLPDPVDGHRLPAGARRASPGVVRRVREPGRDELVVLAARRRPDPRPELPRRAAAAVRQRLLGLRHGCGARQPGSADHHPPDRRMR